MSSGNYNNDMQYTGAFDKLRKNVLAALKAGGLAVEDHAGRIFIPLGDTGESIHVDVERTYNRERWSYLNPNTRYTGVRISYKGTCVRQYKKHLKPKYHNGIWQFDSKVLVAKTKEALEHAISVHDTWHKEAEQELLIKTRTIEAFKEYIDPDIERDDDQPLRITGEKVRIKTGWGTITMQTSDGEVFTIQRIEYNSATRSLPAQSINELIDTLGRMFDWQGVSKGE